MTTIDGELPQDDVSQLAARLAALRAARRLEAKEAVLSTFNDTSTPSTSATPPSW